MKWNRPGAVDSGRVQEISNTLKLQEVTAEILTHRLPDPTVEAAKRFLEPSLSHLHDAGEIAGMKAAAARLALAIDRGERIVVHGDYDADGVTATAVLVRCIRALRGMAEPYLPCRFTEGYGIGSDFVAQAIDSGVNVVVTVDCGIKEHERIAALAAAGIDVIITDHHESGEGPLPEAFAVIDPKIPGSTYPFRELVGVGVAWKLALALCQIVMGGPRVGDRLQRMLLGLLPLVAVGTIADVAPLFDENRVLVKYGLSGWPQAPAGLRALSELARCKNNPPTAHDVSWQISPRLNAAGRMSGADLALQVLLADDPADASDYAAQLDRENTSRREMGKTVAEQVRAVLSDDFDPDKDGAIVVAGEGWHEGVIGIVSARLSDEFHCPAIVISIPEDGGLCRGSARSVPGLNLYEVLNAENHRFETFGGHEQAAGFSIRREQIAPLRAALTGVCKQQIREDDLRPGLDVDAVVSADLLSLELALEFEKLAPFGEANPVPLLLVEGARVTDTPRIMGQAQNHFFFRIAGKGCGIRTVVFDQIEFLQEIDNGTREWDMVAELQVNRFQGRVSPELIVKDMRPAAAALPETA